MKIIHLSDLHLGKRVNEFSMIEDQQYILAKILNIIDQNNIDAIIIAGDVYDKSVPSSEAVTLLDWFLVEITNRKLQAFIISGNHDSAERLAFGSQIMNKQSIYFSSLFNGTITPTCLETKQNNINFYMLPFIKPANVKRFYPDKEITTYTDAVNAVIKSLNIDQNQINVCISHQFVTGATTCDSEDISVGGIDNVDAEVFDPFDYVALGHIHNPQTIKRETIRYCGTPLKYSFSESNQIKSATIIDIISKHDIKISTIDLIPKRDLRKIKGSYQEITLLENYQGTNTDDYMHITLTDEQDIPDAISKLRSIYPNIMKLDYDNKRTRSYNSVNNPQDFKKQSPLEVFDKFYTLQNNQELNNEQKSFISSLIESIWND